MNTSALKVYLAFTATGSIDYKKSAENLIGDLQSYEAVLDATGEKVEAAILAVFAKHKGVNLNKPALTSFAMTELGATPENYSVYQEGINSFLKANVGDRGAAPIGMRKGIGGGFWLWADKALTADEAKAVAAAPAVAVADESADQE